MAWIKAKIDVGDVSDLCRLRGGVTGGASC